MYCLTDQIDNGHLILLYSNKLYISVIRAGKI